jgi:hypothetical protein
MLCHPSLRAYISPDDALIFQNKVYRMRHILLITLAVLLLASCAPLKLHYKEGQPVSRMATDLAMCKSQALAQVPEDIRTRYIPPPYPPYGYYGPYGGYYYPYYPYAHGRFERYDANQSKRDEVTTQCMQDQGYTQVKLPTCSPDIVRATQIHATKVMPPLSEKSCAIRLKSGGWQIVTPG